MAKGTQTKQKPKAAKRPDWAADEIYVDDDGADTYWGTSKPEIVLSEGEDVQTVALYKFDRMVTIEKTARVTDA